MTWSDSLPARAEQTPVPASPPPRPPSVTGRRPSLRRPGFLLVPLLAVLLVTPAAVAALISAQQPTEYAAVVELIHEPEDNSSVEGVDREMATHQVLLQRRSVVQEVAAEMGRSADDLSDDLSVEVVDGSSVLRTQMVDTDPDRAEETLDVLVGDYLASADRLAQASDIGQLRVLAPPAVLHEPVGPDPLRAGAAGLLLGILLAGTLLALLRLRRERGRTV